MPTPFHKMISVCIATYNGEKYIAEQLSSILTQIGDDDEVIVSDDASTDNTLQVIETLGDKRIKVFKHDKNEAKFSIDYATRNFENAIWHSHGDIIFLADQDDVWLDGKVKAMVEALSDADMVMSDCYIADANLTPSCQYYKSGFREFKPSILYNFIKPSFLGSCMAFRRSVIDKALPFPKYGVGHDLWLGLVGLRHFKFRFLPQPLMLYRRHEATVTDGGKANHTSLLFKLKYRMYVLRALVKLL